MLTLVGKDLASRTGVLGELASQLGRAGIAITASTTNDTFVCLYLAERDGEAAYRLLHSLMTGSQREMGLVNVTLRPGVAEVRLRSPEFLQTPGILAEITSVLARRRINILEMITSLTDIYIYVDRGDQELTLSLLRELTTH